MRKINTIKMKQPQNVIIKRLFGLSNNQCYFPKCNTNLIDKKSGVVLGEICHIKAQSPGGPRYDVKQTDEERNSFENLLLLCPTHHTVIDSDEEAYTVERLNKMKENHEAKSTGNEDIPDDMVEKLITNNVYKISTETSVQNAIHSQFAGIIQNINAPIDQVSSTTYEFLLGKIHSGTEPLSKNLSDVLSIAKSKNDNHLVNLCMQELSGWNKSSLPASKYRIQTVYLSPYSISRVVNLSMTEFWKDLESRPNQYVKKEMFFAESVPSIEYYIESNKSIDPSKSYMHLTRKNGDLFSGLGQADLEVNIYCKGSLYYDLLTGIRLNLADEIMKRIK